jgi:hypothetical protein
MQPRRTHLAGTTLTVDGHGGKWWWKLSDATGFFAGANGYRTKDAAYEAGREAQDERIKANAIPKQSRPNHPAERTLLAS